MKVALCFVFLILFGCVNLAEKSIVFKGRIPERYASNATCHLSIESEMGWSYFDQVVDAEFSAGFTGKTGSKIYIIYYECTDRFGRSVKSRRHYAKGGVGDGEEDVGELGL
jgi:hypothetical protein